MKKRKTNYLINSIIIIVEDTFHDYPIGTKVKIMSCDNYSYHVVNVTNVDSERRFWWVNENQIEYEDA